VTSMANLTSKYAGEHAAHRRSQGGEKFFRRNLQGKFVSAPLTHQVHPTAEEESIFRTFSLVGGDLEVGVIHL